MHQSILTSLHHAAYLRAVRTTLQIADDVLTAARSLAEAHGRTLGEVISDLARRGLAPREPVASERGFPIFEISSSAPPITLERVQQALDES